MSAESEYEYIVVGLGAIGSAAAYWLARRAPGRVLGLEQFSIGNDEGASGDHSRIIRLTYHTPAYVALARHALAAWQDVQEVSGESLMVTTGDLFLGPRGGAMPVQEYAAAMTDAGLPFEYLDAAEIMRRFPQFRLDENVHGTYQPGGGLIAAARGVLAHARLARERGAVLKEHETVLSIHPLADGMDVWTSNGQYRCRRLVLCADAWINQLLAPLGWTLPLTLSQEQVTYVASPHLQDFESGRFPVWIWADDPNFYGTPVYGESRAIKASQDAIQREVTLQSRTHSPDTATEGRVLSFLQSVLPRAYGPILYSKTCMYTLPPDRDFIVDNLPEAPSISIGLGAGHGYKFSSLIGRILSDLAIDGRTSFDISPFAANRPILRMQHPPRNFLLRHARQSESSVPS